MEDDLEYKIFRISNRCLDAFPWIDPDAPVIGKRKPLTGKEKARRKAKRKMAKKSKRQNR